jgi:membrane protease YdiL (CAAX protease family)/predicted RNA-binding Zn-ribbon protein involved in translation (DUF1610 family)
MSDKNDSAVKYCVYCGAKVEKDQVYCPNCGKLVIKAKKNAETGSSEPISSTPQRSMKGSYTRKCPGCGSIISSMVLEQCPICNEQLDPVPEIHKKSQTKTGFIFTQEKLVPEQRISKDSWILKEGLNVFTNSILLYIIVQFFLIMFIWFQLGFNESQVSEITIFLIIISQIPGIVLGLFPLWYLKTNNHSMEKLGLPVKDKKIPQALIIGIMGGLGVLFLSIISGIITNYIYELGIDFYDIQEYMEMESDAIRNGGLWIIVLLIELIISAISTELVFRGVLHNTLKTRLEYLNNKGKIYTILIVATVYSVLYLLFSFPIGIYFIIPNFLVFILLGILYEINENLYNTIIASVVYNIALIIIIVFL